MLGSKYDGALSVALAVTDVV